MYVAMTTYYSINWHASATLPDFLSLETALMELKNESVYTAVRPYAESFALTEEEHDALHSARLHSDVSYPHSFVDTPIHLIPNNYESKIVGSIGVAFAWDYALRFLLPSNVGGIIVKIQNSCNQTSLYELIGHDAFYLGDDATKESKYDHMEVVRDLTPSTHPNITKVSGHCRYTIVRQ